MKILLDAIMKILLDAIWLILSLPIRFTLGKNWEYNDAIIFFIIGYVLLAVFGILYSILFLIYAF